MRYEDIYQVIELYNILLFMYDTVKYLGLINTLNKQKIQ